VDSGAASAEHREDLASGRLAKSVHDVAWASFFSKLAHKAENAGRALQAVNPQGTSQTCTCGAAVWKELSCARLVG
jgi:putative transposase